jgi:hypothetical protein
MENQLVSSRQHLKVIKEILPVLNALVTISLSVATRAKDDATLIIPLALMTHQTSTLLGFAR